MEAGSTFSAAHIGLTAGLVGVASLLVVVTYCRPVQRRLVLGVVVTSMVATFGWRMAANVGALNEDGISWISANDVLAPMLTYMLLGMYASFFPPPDSAKFEKLRCGITGVALVINVIAI